MKQQKGGKMSAFPHRITYWKKMSVCRKNIHKYIYLYLKKKKKKSRNSEN